jgi:hypothetical protein
MEAREQRQGADYGNDDSNGAIARVRVKMAAVHTDLLANGSVVHEVKVWRIGLAVAGFSANSAYLPVNDRLVRQGWNYAARQEGTILAR